MNDKPLGYRAYGHIPHLPGSRMGPGDHACHEGQARIATVRVRDRRDEVWVQEKVDGTCVAVAKTNGELVPLIRAGYRAIESPHEQHHLFDAWVRGNRHRFDLKEGERLCGEWLAMAHGTRYDLTPPREPFVAFDLMRGSERMAYREFDLRFCGAFDRPRLIATGPTSIEAAMAALGTFGFYGALDPVEGAVWRVERDGKVDFLCKYVRPDKVDGKYFSDDAPVWNWRPAA